MHLAAIVAVVLSVQQPGSPSDDSTPRVPQHVDAALPRLVFIASESHGPGGGGGGGNRQPGPIRHAEAVGRDHMTLQAAKPIATSDHGTDTPPLQPLVLDAKPLASGSIAQVGLPVGGVSFGTSTGPGSGGGVGDGVGTGIGSGRGPGMGSGSGGGIGGGVYRAGGAVTPPRLISQVRPSYTGEALSRKIQGSVVLDLVVAQDGRPADLRVIQSIDPGGLDEQALLAVRQWRFDPGRLAGTPVDVMVTVVIDFSIR